MMVYCGAIFDHHTIPQNFAFIADIPPFPSYSNGTLFLPMITPLEVSIATNNKKLERSNHVILLTPLDRWFDENLNDRHEKKYKIH